MQTAKVMINLGGDTGHQVPKLVTAAEIPVLLAIHGNDAVTDIDPQDDVERSNREELDRLVGIYGRATDSENNPIIRSIYPGAGARVFQTLEELGLPDVLYKPTARAKALAAAAEPGAATDEPAAEPKKGRRGKKDAAEAAAPVEDALVVDDTEADGVAEMPDGGDALFK